MYSVFYSENTCSLSFRALPFLLQGFVGEKRVLWTLRAAPWSLSGGSEDSAHLLRTLVQTSGWALLTTCRGLKCPAAPRGAATSSTLISKSKFLRVLLGWKHGAFRCQAKFGKDLATWGQFRLSPHQGGVWWGGFLGAAFYFLWLIGDHEASWGEREVAAEMILWHF